MKAAIFLLLFLLLPAVRPADAADKWSVQDYALEASWGIVHLIDWGQTRYIAKNPDRYHECNPILGRHPSVGQVDIYMGAGLILHPIVAALLPTKARILGLEFNPRAAWQTVTIFSSGICVVNNINIGVSIAW